MPQPTDRRDEPVRVPPDAGPLQREAAELKPLTRGWFHALMAPTALVAGLLLAAHVSGGLRTAALVYTASAVIMFGNSAIYHRFYARRYWRPAVKQVFRRLDHAFIFVFIAGTYTPLSVALLHGASRVVLLSVVWGIAIVGTLFRVFWLSAPRWLYTALYIVMGWVAVWWMPELWHAGGPAVVWWLAVGGLIYTLGAVAYGLKKPDPWPRIFGFHEIFHLCTVLAAVAHYVSIWLAVNAVR